jgi:pimeloyl-ACP methyl ester carboxylesterase
VKRFVSISSLTHCTWFTEVIGDYLGISRSTMARARRIVDDSYARPVNWETLSVVEMLARLTMPMLLIHDLDDQEIPFEHSQKILRAVRHAEFQATQGLGHRRLLKDPNVLDLVTRFAGQKVAA